MGDIQEIHCLYSGQLGLDPGQYRENVGPRLDADCLPRS